MPPREAIPEALLRAVLSHWDLGEVSAASELTTGASHRTFHVQARRGAAFLRCYARPDAALSAREHTLIRHVRAAGLPAALPIASIDGRTAIEHEGALYALYEPAQGVHVPRGELGIEHARSSGETLARLHAALSPLGDAGYVHWTLAWDGAEWVERLNVAERAIVLRGVRDDADRWALERVRAQRQWMLDPACAHRYVPVFSPQVTHGDFHEANLFFDAGAVSGIIDWDQGGWMPRAYETARACGFMFMSEPSLVRAFIEAYRAASGASREELEDGARAWGVFSDHHVWPVEQVYLHQNENARRFLGLGRAPFRPFVEAWREIFG